MKRILGWCLAMLCTCVLIHCKTKEKVTTSNEISTSSTYWHDNRVQRSMFSMFDTVDVYQFPDLAQMFPSTDGADTTATVGHPKYRFIRHIAGVATDSIHDTIKSHIHNETTKNSVSSKTQPKSSYNATQYAVFYIALVLVLIIVFWIKR